MLTDKFIKAEQLTDEVLDYICHEYESGVKLTDIFPVPFTQEALAKIRHAIKIREIDAEFQIIEKLYKRGDDWVDRYNIFINKDYDVSLLNYISDKIEQLIDHKTIEESWLSLNFDSSISDYRNFIERWPNSKYADEAKVIINKKKLELVGDMRHYPMKYTRDEVRDLISSDVFSEKELIEHGLLTEEAFLHIKKYPYIGDECFLYSVNTNSSPKGDVDVLPLGVSGSGGKTCLLLSIMGCLDDDFKLNGNSEDAERLHHSACESCLPPATNMCLLDAIDTYMKIGTKWHGVSFVEFAGEMLPMLADDDGVRFVSGNNKRLDKLLSNNNRKILLFAVDFSNDKNVPIGEGDCQRWISQSDLLWLLVSKMAKDTIFCSKILSIKVILTKNDLFGIKSCHQAINELNRRGYGNFWNSLLDVCRKNGIMPYNDYMPEVIPYSIGKFMIGQTYKFNKGDAVNLLQSIKTDMNRQ